MFYMLQYVGQKPASWREAAGHTVQIYQDISDLLLSHFSSWLSFNITWIYINNKKILDFTGNFWKNSKIAYKEFLSMNFV